MNSKLASVPYLLALTLTLGACKARRSDVREWRVSDHDHTTKPGTSQVEVQADGKSALASLGIDEVTVVAWNRSCATCHGAYGRGDGPQAAMTGARDLTTAEWQDSTNDAAIARAIREGRGRMPAFGSLPEPTVQALVRLIRLFDPRRPAPGSSAAAASASAPPASAPAPPASASAPPASASAPPASASAPPRP